MCGCLPNDVVSGGGDGSAREIGIVRDKRWKWGFSKGVRR